MGYYLAKDWLLPDFVFQAILWHHDYPALEAGTAELPPTSIKLIAVGLAADYALSRHAEDAPGQDWTTHGDYALEQLDMEQADLDELMPKVCEALDERV